MSMRTHAKLLSVLHVPASYRNIGLGWGKRTVQVIGAVLLCCSLYMTVFAGKQDSQESCASSNCQLIFYEGFESGFGPQGWSSTAGLWETCDPSICPPPDSSRSGDSCAATVCCASLNQSTRLEGPFYGIPLPEVDSGEHIIARFWQCFWNRVSHYSDASIRCDVSVDGGPWITKFGPISSDNATWHMSPQIDLTEYASSSVRLGFLYTRSYDQGSHYSRGWYVDDIIIEKCGFGCYAGADKSICKGGSIAFLDVYVQYGVPPYTYSWSPCEGLSDCNILYPVASPETTMAYILIAYDSGIPPDSCIDTVVVTVLPAPEVNLQDTTINIGTTLVLDAGGPYDNYQWSTGAVTRTISFTPSTLGDSLFWVEVSNEGCTVVDSAVVHVIDTSGPTNVEATDNDCDKVVITWSDNSTYEEGYRVYRNGTQVCDVGPNIETCTDYPDPGNYAYCVHLYQGAYESPDSPEACDEGARLDVPSIPTNVTASTDMVNAVRIEWSPAEFATSYTVYRDDEPEPIGSTADTAYIDRSVYAGEWYTYCVNAVNNCGESGCSVADSGMALTDIVMTEVAVYPNPTGTIAHITYTLWESADVTVELFTLRGRQIRAFTHVDATDGQGSSIGEHIIDWDLTNESGSVVANGVYICRVTSEGRESGKTVEIKKKVSVVK